MNHERKADGDFEERLLMELQESVRERAAAGEQGPPLAAPPHRRRGQRLVLGGAVAAAGVAAALVATAGGSDTPAAFAVEPRAGGGVTISVNSPEDASGLEAALAEAGIRSEVDWLGAGMECREPRFTPSTVKTALGGRIGGFNVAGPKPTITIGVLSAAELRQLRQEARNGEITLDDLHGATGNITLDPAELRPDQTVVISGAPGPSADASTVVNGPQGAYEVDPEGGFEAHVGIAEGPVEPCEPVEVADGGTLGQLNRVLAEEAAKRGR